MGLLIFLAICSMMGAIARVMSFRTRIKCVLLPGTGILAIMLRAKEPEP